jgi:hypothetical protein
MLKRPRRSQFVVPLLALALAACGGAGVSADPDPTPTAAATDPAPTPDVTIEPTAAQTDDATDPGEPSQTDTDWGRIWDAVPADFPRYPGGTIAEDVSPEPVSAAYAFAEGDPAQIAEWMQTSLEMATYSTEGLSGPLEDGGYVLDSVGDGGCRIQTKVTPMGTMIIVTVRYGAACPF